MVFQNWNISLYRKPSPVDCASKWKWCWNIQMFSF